jgi:hypothetical protein
MRWLLKSSFDQNLVEVNHKANEDFKNHIYSWKDMKVTQERFVVLLHKKCQGSTLCAFAHKDAWMM